MALTRAQLISGTASQGTVLLNQVQGVKQGTGVLIAGDGSISVDWTAATGLVKLNNTLGYNAYVWPAADGAASTFLRTDGGGNLSWAKAGVTVSAVAPTSPSIGDLWFDCATGQLKVWESCTTGVAQWSPANIGLPVLPISTSASPAFTSGTGTTVDPYICTLTTTASGSTVAIVNTVTVTGLAPNQFVAIQDLNTAVNGGRFTFTNYFADNAGDLVFSTIFQDLPASVAGTIFTAAIKVGFASAYIDSVVNIASTFALVSPGSISGTAAAGSTLTYTLGSYSGGTAPVTEGWVWKKGSDGSTLQTGGATYVIPSSLIGDRVYVTYTATDSLLLVVTGDTTNYPTPPSTITASLVTNAVAPITIPGTANFTWADGAQNLTATGCIEFSKNSDPFTQASTAVIDGDVITTQWLNSAGSGLCGDAPNGTTITGTLTDGTRTSNFSLVIDKVPNAFTLLPATETIDAGSVTVTNPSFTVSGTNSPSYIWGSVAPTGSNPQYSIDNGVTWASLPSAPGTAYVDPGQTVKVRFTTVTPSSTEVLTVEVGATTLLKQSGTFTVTVTTAGVTNAVAPITIPGTANFTWADGAGNLSATGCIEFSLDGGVTWLTASTPVTNGATITTQWKNVASSGLCGDAANGTVITGTLTNGTKTSNFSLTLDKVPDAFTFSPATETITPNSVTITNPSFTVAGINAPAKIWGAFTTTGSLPQYSVDGGTTWTAIPTAPGTDTVDNGETVQIRFTTSAAPGTEVFTLDVGASAVLKQSGTFTVTVTNSGITNAVAPTTTPGTANFTWADGAQNLSATGCIEFKVGAGSFTQASTPVVNGDTITTQWVNVASSGLCGDAAHGTTITGTLTDGIRTTNFSLTLDRVPSAFTLSPATETTTRITQTTSNPSFTVAGINAPAYIWGTFIGTTPQYSTDAGTTWNTIPAAISSASTVTNGQTVRIRYTTTSTIGTETNTINVGASAVLKQSGTFTVSVVTAVFPNTALVAPTTIPGVGGPVTWADGATSITGTGCIEFSKNGGTYTQASTAVVNGDLIRTQWVTSPACNGAANGTTITGTVTNGVYTNSFSLLIDRAPTFTFTDLTNQAQSTVITSSTVTPASYNSTTYITKTAGTLTSVEASVNGGAWTAIPASGTTMPINPTETLQIRGTTGAALNTSYTATISIGGVTDVWSVKTVTVAPAVNTPSILTPAQSATGIATNVTVTSSAYSITGAPGTHTCSDWEVLNGLAVTATMSDETTWYPVLQDVNVPLSSLPVVGNSPIYPAAVVKFASGKVITNGSGASSNCYISTTGNSFTTTSSFGGAIRYLNYFSAASRVVGVGPTRIVYSTDEGSTWVNVPFTGITEGLAGAVWVSGTTYIAAETDTSAGVAQRIMKTTDAGLTWTAQSTYTPAIASAGNQALFASSAGTLFLFRRKDDNTNKIFQSTDQGVTFTEITAIATVGPYNLTQTTSGMLVYWGDDTSFYSSVDNGVTWTARTVTGTVNTFTGSNNVSYDSGSNTLLCTSNWNATVVNLTAWTGTTSANSAGIAGIATYFPGQGFYDGTDWRMVLLTSLSTGDASANQRPNIVYALKSTTSLSLSTTYAYSAFPIGSTVTGNNGATGVVQWTQNRSGNPTLVVLAPVASALWLTATSVNNDTSTFPVVVNAVCDTTNKTSYPLSGLSALTTYSVRTRYKSSSGLYSSWSPYRNFTTA